MHMWLHICMDGRGPGGRTAPLARRQLRGVATWSRLTYVPLKKNVHSYYTILRGRRFNIVF